MTEAVGARRLLERVARRMLQPLASSAGIKRFDLEYVLVQQQQLAASVEQAVRAQDRLEAYFDRFREEIRAEFGDLVDASAQLRSILEVLDVAPAGTDEPAANAGIALQRRFDHSMLHAEAVAAESLASSAKDLAEIRATVRLTQALAERAMATPPASTDAPTAGVAPTEPAASAPAASYAHAVPSFDLLYRSFEDRHRGSVEEITERQRSDYLSLLSELPHPELPIADLGCGRGELVQLLNASGQSAVGVDSNLSQVLGGNETMFWEQDLFEWLDAQADSSHRAIVSMHVVEHLPLDLQIRLVFESRRVLAEGGLLVLETPNTLSLSVAASNFWVDPTHQRPVHPLFLEFLATEAGFADAQTRLLHPLAVEFTPTESAEALVNDLNTLILGAGDMALVARR